MQILLAAYLQWSFYDLLMRIPSLGLASIAAHMDKQFCNVKSVDLLVGSYDTEGYFRSLLRKYKPDIVGLSVITLQYFEALKLAEITKKFNRNIKVVMGGYHPTLDYAEIFKNDVNNTVDFIIRGEAEVAFNELVKSLVKGQDFSKVPGLSYRYKDSIIHNPTHKLLDPGEIKRPDRDVRINKKGYHLFGYPADIIEMSRGCPFNCSFCISQAMYGRSYRKFSIERILEDIKDIKHRGAKAVFVADHNVTGDPKWYKEVCCAIIDSGLNNIKYGVQATVRGIKQVPGLAETMVKSGVEWVLLGIENVSHVNMDFIHKEPVKDTDVFEVVSELKKHGAIVMGTFVLGCPEDKEEDFIANYNYAREIGIDIASFLTLTPYPNTPVRDELIRQDLITNLYDYSKYDLGFANARTKYLSAEHVFELTKECNQKFLSNTGYLWLLVKKYPVYMTKITLKELRRDPGFVFGYLKSLLQIDQSKKLNR